MTKQFISFCKFIRCSTLWHLFNNWIWEDDRKEHFRVLNKVISKEKPIRPTTRMTYWRIFLVIILFICW